MAVAGKAESDADIMASLRNRTSTLGDDDADDDGAPAAPTAAAPAEPPAPPKPKRMTMAEKIKMREAEMARKKKEEDDK